ncbi:hypothetical protein ACHAXM_011261 [Skeletonema potamos]|jgi:hypothetical protein
MMLQQQQQRFSRNIAAAFRQSNPIGRFLCSAVGSGDNIEIKKSRPRSRNRDAQFNTNIRRSVRLGGDNNESSHGFRPSGDIENSFQKPLSGANLRRLEDTLSRGNSQHGWNGDSFPNGNSLPRNSNTQRSLPEEDNRKSKHTPESAENKQLYQSIIKCMTINDTVKVAYDHLDILSPRTTAAVWKHLSSLLSKPPHHNGSNEINIDERRLKKQLVLFLNHTSNQIATHNPTVLSNTAHALASIVKTALVLNENKKHNGVKQLFRNLLINDNLTIWNKLLHRYLQIEQSFGARQIATVAWSIATVLQPITRNTHNNSLDVAPFFGAVHRAFQSNTDEFSTKHMVNLAWSCMTCRHSMPELFDELADEFISRRLDDETSDNEESLDAVTLCQLASSFAKARHNDARLFEAIARAVLSKLTDFDGRQLANLIQPFAFAKIVPVLADDGRTLFDEVAKVAILQIKSLAPQNMANIVWAYATTEQSNPALFNAIAQEATPRLKEFSSKQLANLAWALSKHPPQSKENIFDQIALEVVNRGLESFTNQGLTMMAHSFATVGHTTDDEFWNNVEEAATKRASEFGYLECVQMAWSFATIERPSDELFRRLERVAISNIRTFNSQGLSNLSWAFSLLGYDSLPLFQAIAESSMRKMNEFKPAEKAMLVLSFSRISHPFPSLFDKVASRSISELNSFGSLDLFNMVISFSKADASKRNKNMLKAIADEIVCRPSSLSPKMLVGIAWSYANEVFRYPKLFNFISKECLGYCASFNSQEVASLAWSFVSVGCRDRLLLQTLAEKSDNRWQEFNAQPLANMVWAYATAEEDRPPLFEGIADAAVGIKEDFTSQGVSNLLWAFAYAGYPEQHLFQSLATPASLVLHEANHQSLANIAWAYSVANVEDSSLFNEQFVNACVEKEHDFDYQGFRQLHQWNVWRKELNSDIVLPHELGTRCYNEFTRNTLVISDLQKQVASVLHSVGLNPDEEVETKSGYMLDATFIHNGKVIGLEVDGPYHFVGRKKKGNTILKQRQIANVDLIPVISVPYWEWIDLQTLDDKEGYILNKISQSK